MILGGLAGCTSKARRSTAVDINGWGQDCTYLKHNRINFFDLTKHFSLGQVSFGESRENVSAEKYLAEGQSSHIMFAR